MSSRTLKCVVVGDGTVGKTCLLIRYAKDEFPSNYIPTVFDNYAVSLSEGSELHLFDTAGQEEYDQLRKLTCDNTDVFLICFSVILWSSFVNVREKWVPELQEVCPGVPFVLVGTKTDLRNDQKVLEFLAAEGRNPISTQQGEKLAKELKAVKYMECSALTKENVADVFREAIHIALLKELCSPANNSVKASGGDDNNNNKPAENHSCCMLNNCLPVSQSLSYFCSPQNCSIL